MEGIATRPKLNLLRDNVDTKDMMDATKEQETEGMRSWLKTVNHYLGLHFGTGIYPLSQRSTSDFYLSVAVPRGRSWSDMIQKDSMIQLLLISLSRKREN